MPARFSGLLALALAIGSASVALAAVPVPPDQVAYSGVLLDGGGAPLAGPVDLTARVYDAASGGTLIFTQSFTGVGLEDGHFTLNLGPTGVATDSPSNPLTTSLRTALSGDLAAGPGRFVEITVDTDPPLARVALVLVPYAIRADHATTSDVAANALDTESVVGLDGAVLTELYEHYNEDGGPPASDPSEGTADPDLDGDLNFVDPDNDNDGLSDDAEVDLGSDLNLITPAASTVAPGSGEGDQLTPVTVTGTGFLPGMTAQLGSQSLTISNLTTNSFETSVGPQSGPYPVARALTVTNTNGELTVKSNAFTFQLTAPAITNITPSTGASLVPTLVTVEGTGFLPGLTAAFGSQLFTPTLASNSFQVTVAPEAAGTSVNVQVTNANGLSHSIPDGFAFGAPAPIPLPFTLAGATKPVSIVARGEELLVYGSQANNNRYAIDTVVDGTIAFDVSTYMNSTVPSALGWSPTRVLHGLRGQGNAQGIQLLHDANGDNFLSTSAETTVLENPGGTPKTQSPSIAFDGAGRPGGGYVRNVSGVQTAMAFHDRNGDGSFASLNEVVAVEPVAGAIDDLGEAAFDASGRLAYAYGVGSAIRLAWDRSGDGNFDDTVSGVPELSTVTASVGAGCLGLAFDHAGRLAIVNGENLFHDLTGDGDFADAGETIALSNACDVAAASQGNRIVIARLQGSDLRVLTDLTNDGDFADADEDVFVGAGISHPIALTLSASGAVRVLTPQGVVRGPIR